VKWLADENFRAAARTIEDVLLLDECSIETDWTSGVLYLPLL
jgi:hypothetical protein